MWWFAWLMCYIFVGALLCGLFWPKRASPALYWLGILLWPMMVAVAMASAIQIWMHPDAEKKPR